MQTNERPLMSTNTSQHDLILKQECFNIVGACMALYNELGSAFLEPVYQEALSLEFSKRNIPLSKEHRLEIFYKEALLDKKYFADFLCYDQIIVELKAWLGTNRSTHRSSPELSFGSDTEPGYTDKLRHTPPAMEAGDLMKPSCVFIRALSFVFIRGN